MKKIYFAGAIRGGRNDATLYKEIIDFIKKDNIVLTEHIGNPSLSSEGEKISDEEIYERDIAWLKESDMVIAECTSVSLGVGYELGFAESINKPVYIFYRPQDTHLSGMLNGNKYFKVYPYITKEELFSLLESLF